MLCIAASSGLSDLEKKSSSPWSAPSSERAQYRSPISSRHAQSPARESPGNPVQTQALRPSMIRRSRMRWHGPGATVCRPWRARAASAPGSASASVSRSGRRAGPRGVRCGEAPCRASWGRRGARTRPFAGGSRRGRRPVRRRRICRGPRAGRRCPGPCRPRRRVRRGGSGRRGPRARLRGVRRVFRRGRPGRAGRGRRAHRRP